MRRFTLCMAMIMLALPLAGHAKATRSLDTRLPPPATPVYEVSVSERPGFIRTPGYWMWNGKNHVWQHSRWVEKREGYVWVPEQWQQRGDKWHLILGHWQEDEDYEDASTEAPAQVKPQTAAPAEPAPSVKKQPLKKRVRKTDYRDPVLWPSPRRH